MSFECSNTAALQLYNYNNTMMQLYNSQQQKTNVRGRTDRAWFSGFEWHPTRK